MSSRPSSAWSTGAGDLELARARAAEDRAGHEGAGRRSATPRPACRRLARLKEARTRSTVGPPNSTRGPGGCAGPRPTGTCQPIAEEVSLVERAVAEFERAAEELVRARGDATDRDEDLKGRLARIERLTGENDEAAEVLAEKQTAYLASEEELRVYEQVSGAEYEQIINEISETETAWKRRGADQKTAAVEACEEHDKFVEARRDLELGREALAAAIPSCSPRRPCSRLTPTATCGRCSASRNPHPGRRLANGPLPEQGGWRR